MGRGGTQADGWLHLPARQTRRLARRLLCNCCGLVDELVNDALGASRPPSRDRTATRIESEVGSMVGHGMYYSVTQVYITFSLGSGESTGRWMSYA